MSNNIMDHLAYLDAIAAEDLETIKSKERDYGASWKRRGGTGAFMAMIRKADRLEEIAKKYNYDIFAALSDKSSGESLLDTIKDLRCYLDLIESEHRLRVDIGEQG